MATQKALRIIRANSGGSGDEIIAVNGDAISVDFSEMGGDPSDIHLPDIESDGCGLWLFEGTREPADVQESDDWTYAGTYRRPTPQDMETIILLQDGWE